MAVGVKISLRRGAGSRIGQVALQFLRAAYFYDFDYAIEFFVEIIYIFLVPIWRKTFQARLITHT